MTQSLEAIAKALVADGKGILAADESTGTITKRFAGIGVESTFENRRAYRNLLFTADGIEAAISGVILYDETIRQKADDGRPFPELLKSLGIHSGIKVDAGAKEHPLRAGEKVTEGLDGLRGRIAEYVSLGATFAKWRAVITIGAGIPSRACLETNAHALARYAALCQEGGLVPIVEPEVLMDGDHSIERCFDVTAASHEAVFRALREQGVSLEGMLLKPNMVIAAKDADRQAGIDEVARETLRCFYRTVPAAVAGVVFLSGGQGPEDATHHLDAMNKMGPLPWPLTFSYGRALQAPALAAWQGKAEQVPAAQAALIKRSNLNRAAALGEYSPSMEKGG